MYQVIDKLTKILKGTYKSRISARRAADKFDNKIGGYRHIIIEINN